MEDWIYHNPKFECDKINYELLRYSPWSGHRNFAYDFVSFFKPKTIVELGSYYGCSAFAFMQAIKDQNLNLEFYGIDTWSGDDFTKDDYKQNVFLAFSDVVKKCFKEQNVNMLRKTFDEAIVHFKDNSIDLLHIDGSHHYEDVKYDFETWFSKVKNDGIIMFHDISADKMYGKIMGSHCFWEELKQKFTFTFQFDFSYGLGVLFLSEKKYNLFIKSIDIKKYQQINNSLSVEYKDELRKNYFILEDNKFHINSLYEQLKIKDNHLNSYKEDVGEKDKYIKELEKQIEERDKGLNDYQLNVEGKDKYIKELEQQVKERDKGLNDYQLNVEDKDKYIKELEQQIDEKEKSLNGYKLKVKEKDIYIEGLEKKVTEKENYIYEIEEKVKKSFFGKFIKR
ncbi:class I SAM-dependent methyltransferase [Clostridium taeniosporum]|uniref:Class I SAM-dependent methyltransferase n=1 Tax=Clostridium taeniosporum TaxID=394958 RepID=A0A1D7XMT0_9CLOT|nr:class I SAM-dependent methyltransferase [Clostridium taeniosporum]AOR24587.1 hypothetical protein BGI42_12930 [Clostridium taeniosporum]